MIRRKFTLWERQLIAERARHRCEYCQWWKKYTNAPYDNEHIDPISKDGANELYNIAYACKVCNGKKYNKTEGYDAITDAIVRLYHPRKDRWLDHFQWSADSIYIIGITPIGRATVELLDMNRQELIDLRTVFNSIGIHPPSDY